MSNNPCETLYGYLSCQRLVEVKSKLAFSPSSIAVPSVVVVAHCWRLVRHVDDMIKEKGE